MQVTFQTADDWCGWAQVEHQEGRMDRARAGFQRALALDPSSIPSRFGLASVLLVNDAVAEAAAVAARMSANAAALPQMLWLQARMAHVGGHADDARDVLTRL